MMKSIVPLFAAALAALLGSTAAAQPASPRPTLVVFITVDQLVPDYLMRWERQLTGGLARFTRGGAVFLNGFQDHAVTETAPGHASTLSGRFPASTGIVANSYGVGDPQSPVIGGGASPASPFRFRGSTLIDWMRVADARSRALSVSRKDRGAILPLGRAHQAVFWYASDGRFTTSSYYADTLPDWVEAVNARQVPAGMAGQAWTLLLPESEYPEVDSVAGEAFGRNVTFPHVLPADPREAAGWFPDFPWMDQLTLDMAIAGLRAMQLGRGPHPDLLAVSLSTTDAVGHRYGPESREVHDQVLRLDRMLGAFVDSVYAQVDSARVVFALTSDHGVSSIPEVVPGGAEARGYYIQAGPVVEATRRQLAAGGVDTLAIEFDDGLLFVHADRFRGGSLDPEAVVRDFAGRIRALPGVLRVDYLHDLRALDSAALAADDIARRWVHMIPPDQPIPLVVTLRPRHGWGTLAYARHGSPHDYDALVPILFYGAGIRTGRREEPVRVVDIGPTLAALLAVRPTERLDGRLLSQALAP